jgi:hypothetical protein
MQLKVQLLSLQVVPHVLRELLLLFHALHLCDAVDLGAHADSNTSASNHPNYLPRVIVQYFYSSTLFWSNQQFNR